MNFIIWTVFLLIISFWVLGYYYVQFYGDISAKEHKVSMAQTKLRHQTAGLEKEMEKLQKDMQKMTKEIEKYREQIKQVSE